MKVKDVIGLVAVIFVGIFVVGMASFWAFNGGSFSTTEEADIDPITGEVVLETAPWSDRLVSYHLLTKNKYTGVDVASTGLVFDEQPTKWLDSRYDFTKESGATYSSYTASSGVIDIDGENPGVYYVVLTASGYNQDFVTITIPDGTDMGDIADYESAPKSETADMSTVGTTTDVDFAMTLVNDTSAEIDDTVLLTIGENTEFRGWKVVVNDEEGFSIDVDNNGVYDEGISRYVIIINGEENVVFDPTQGIDEFDSNDKYEILIDDMVIADKDKLSISVEIEGATADNVGANDEQWGEGEGVLSYIRVYDDTSALFSTTDVTA